MIRKIHVQGFKSILDTELESGAIKVLTKPNGSEKATC